MRIVKPEDQSTSDYCHYHRAVGVAAPYPSCTPATCEVMQNHVEEAAMIDAIVMLSGDLIEALEEGEDSTAVGSRLGSALAIRQMGVALSSFHRNPLAALPRPAEADPEAEPAS